jgi:cytochrome c-type biogenesis protein CcmH
MKTDQVVSIAGHPRTALLIASTVLGLAAAGYFTLGHIPTWQSPVASMQTTAIGRPAAPHESAELALVTLRQRLAAAPDDREGWALLARSHATLGQAAEAAEAWRRAEALDQENLDVKVNIADALAASDGPNAEALVEAQRLLAGVLARDPYHPGALALSGRIAHRRGDLIVAARHYEQALRQIDARSPEAADLRSALSAVGLKMSQQQAALGTGAAGPAR